MEPIMLGDTVHVSTIGREGILGDIAYNYSGIVVSISPRYKSDAMVFDPRMWPHQIDGKIITIVNFEDKKVMALGGEWFIEYNKITERKHFTFGSIECMKRVEVGDNVHSSERYVDLLHKTFAGVVTDISYNQFRTNVITIQGDEVRHIDEAWTQEYQDNIFASEEAIRNYKNGASKNKTRKHNL